MKSLWKWAGPMLALVSCISLHKGSEAQAPRVDFARDVEPILKASCVSCHGGTQSQGGLKLDTPEGRRKGGNNGELFGENRLFLNRIEGVGGKPQMPLGFTPLSPEKQQIMRDWVAQGAKESPTVNYWSDIAPTLKSDCLVCHSGADAKGSLDLTDQNQIKAAFPELVKRMRGQGGLPQMPLGVRPLPEAKIQKFESWIAEGGSFEGKPAAHWAYVSPKYIVPSGFEKSNWIRNPIDTYVLAELQARGLKPSPEATRETLIRRLSLDLIGLPPTVEEVDAFLKDTSKNSYDKLVDRLLASPHYGEHMARYWLDLARYGDTNGYEADRTRQAYLYRDWLINAYNRNMPFDQFTRDQLAGDLLPNRTMDQLVATGFHRNSMFNEEGGVDPEESMYETIVDRVNTTSTVWMGSTMACSRCHDHKFDPFTQKDYYGMFAYFGNNVYEPRGDFNAGQVKYYEPNVDVTTPAQTKAITELVARIDAQNKKLQAASESFSDSYEKWKKGELAPTWATATIRSAASKGGATLSIKENKVLASGTNPPNDTYTLSVHGSQRITGLQLSVLPHTTMLAGGAGRASSGNFILTGLKVVQKGRVTSIGYATADYTQGGYSFESAVFGNGQGWAVSPEVASPHAAIVVFDSPLEPGEFQVTMEFNDPTWKEHAIGYFSLSTTSSPMPYLLTPRNSQLIEKSSRTAGEEAELRALFQAIWPQTRTVSREISRLKAEVAKVQSSLPKAMVVADKPSVKRASIRVRGAFNQKADEVVASTPSFLPSVLAGEKTSRLDLAQWLTNKGNPLTARVQVNRMWEMHFGRGIVETSEDFGTQGARPSHPLLLDYLALAFMGEVNNSPVKAGDMKAMHRLIVTSATYRQASVATSDLLEKDPSNVYLARGPRFRLDAELIRDNSLLISGLLNPELGGPSVMPTQPAGVWNSPYSGEMWTNAAAPARYRRGIYTFWKRTSSYPAFVALDAGTREQCLSRRLRTNTPLQALVQLNDPIAMDAARALGEKMASRGIEYGFRACTSRKPLAPELDRLKKLYVQLLTRYRADRVASDKLGKSPEHAAWTMVANVLLNLDETITKE
ncbi:MAG: PSD1 and planctomycete cytochrome C domain-containing protein [Fimbriimonadaceae bacterium]